MKRYLILMWKRYLLLMLISSAIVAMAGLMDTNPPPVTKLESNATKLSHDATNRIPQLTVRWQFDPVRYNNWLVEQDELFAEKFYKTNTTTAHIIHSRYHQPIRVTTNDVELGYVSNGAVVWRVPPEAKP